MNFRFTETARLILGEKIVVWEELFQKTIHDQILCSCFYGLVLEKIRSGEITVGTEEKIMISTERFMDFLELCRKRYRDGFIKTFRDMTTQEFCAEMSEYMLQLGFVRREHGSIRISTAAGKIIGEYPESFLEQGGHDEQ